MNATPTLAASFEDVAKVTYEYQFARLAAGLEEAVNAFNQRGGERAQQIGLRCERANWSNFYTISLYSRARGEKNAIAQIILNDAIEPSDKRSPLYGRIDYEVRRTANCIEHSVYTPEGFDDINTMLAAHLELSEDGPVDRLVQSAPEAAAA